MNQKLGKKSRSRDEVVPPGSACIYCGEPAARLEHMPPRLMFKAKDRPSGMEYPSCDSCNNGTSAADLVASFIAKIKPFSNPRDWGMVENIAQLRSLNELAPGFIDELFASGRASDQALPNQGGVLIHQKVIHANGPLLKAYLDVFAAKMAMALYVEHIGERLPDYGGILTMWFLNAGMSQAQAQGMLDILPGSNDLRQGQKRSTGQFAYNFNSDDRSIIAALSRFHSGLAVWTIAASEPWKYPMQPNGETMNFCRPGHLAAMMPKSERSRVIAVPKIGTSDVLKYIRPARRLD